MKYDDVNITTLLSELDIEFLESGKNIGRGWIGVKTCPFCGDDRHHCGINIRSKKVSCFVCSESASLGRFLKETLNEEWSEIKRLVKNYVGDDFDYYVRETGNKVIMPSNIIDINKYGRHYLFKKRKFDEETITKFKLKQTGPVSFLKMEEMNYKSRFSNRIIIPIYMNRKLVSYTARSFVDEDPKYNNPVVEASMIATGSCIYNYDSLIEGDVGVFVEGPTDVWRFGDQFIALMGVKYTRKQLNFIAKKNLRKGIIFFDAGAKAKAKKLADSLTGIIDKVKIVYMENDDYDPGSIDPYEAIRLKYDLLRV